MKFVIIEKTFIDADTTDPNYGAIYAQFPDNYPMEISVKEYVDLAAAQATNVGKSIMTIDDYNIFKKDLVSQNIDLLNQEEAKTKELNDSL